jgi:glucokinase
MLLAGDIGGTKTTLAVFSPEAGPRSPMAKMTLRSADYPSLEALVRSFLTRVNLDVKRASFGVAGPVAGGRAQVTNLPWVIDEAQLQGALNLSAVRLSNDLLATAHAVPLLEPSDLHPLSHGEPVPRGALAVIAPGTGLGEAYLTWDGSRYQAHASEGGHSSFSPSNSIELELLRYLQGRHEHVSVERVCSGMGLPNLYEYFRNGASLDEPAWLKDQLAGAKDLTPVIVNAALSGERPCAICTATLRTFVSILGAEAGNLALKVFATGGVFLAGGIVPRIIPALEDGGFMKAFTRKGRLSNLLSNVPINLIVNPDVALIGAAIHGFENSGEWNGWRENS